MNVCGKGLLALGELVIVKGGLALEELGDLFNSSWFFLRIGFELVFLFVIDNARSIKRRIGNQVPNLVTNAQFVYW